MPQGILDTVQRLKQRGMRPDIFMLVNNDVGGHWGSGEPPAPAYYYRRHVNHATALQLAKAFVRVPVLPPPFTYTSLPAIRNESIPVSPTGRIGFDLRPTSVYGIKGPG